jgi:two-component sensor histidine kinase
LVYSPLQVFRCLLRLTPRTFSGMDVSMFFNVALKRLSALRIAKLDATGLGSL